MEEEPQSFDHHILSMTDPHDLFVKVTKGNKTVSHRLDEIIKLEPEPAPINGFTASFLELDANSILYKAQLRRYAATRRKPIKWEDLYDTKVNFHLKLNQKSITHSRVKGFMWLFYLHALPVGTRLRGKDTDPSCKICGEEESISHMAHQCHTANTTWKLVTKEWLARTGQDEWFSNPTLSKMFFDKTLKKAHGRSSEHSVTLRCITSGKTDVMCTTAGVHPYPQ